MPEFYGIHHVALTVNDLEVSRPWYSELFAAQPVMDEVEDAGNFHHVVWGFENGTIFGIHQHTKPSSKEPFDERRPGLDHVGFTLQHRDQLKAWEARLNELGIEHGGVIEASYGAGLSFRDPDNNALEFFVLGPAS
jgi:catechol 2,3-dioxygenase-like lactoylglutathione lyase family enzyme